MIRAENLDTDVLVIGGGAAGCTAAIQAHDDGAAVIMLVKGLIGRSGCSIFAGTLDAPPKLRSPALLKGVRRIYSAASRFVRLPVPTRYKEIMESAIRTYQHYLVDQDYVLDAMFWANDYFFPSLEANGFYLVRNPDGSLVTDTGEGAHGIWGYKMGFSGVMFMQYKRKEVFQRKIRVLEETMATRLLKSDNKVVGATALDYAKGRLYAIRAKKTILATGHTNWLSKRTSATREQSANGFAMTFRAGAGLQNMEIQWWHVSDMVAPRSWMRLHNYPNKLPETEKQAKLLNSDMKPFFDGTEHPTAVAPYFLQLKRLYEQVRKGKARWDGGYYTSFQHVEPEPLEKYEYHFDHYKKLGLDMTKDPLESGITWHMTLGGVRTNIKSMETDLPGLLVAGSVGGHFMGGLPFVTYDGTLAGNFTAASSKDMTIPELDDVEVQEEVRRINDFLSNSSPEKSASLPIVVKNRIRDIMWEHMGYVKNEEGMRRALEELDQVKEEMLPKMHLGTSTLNYNSDLTDAVDVFDMLDVCVATINASLARKESRGPFYREDFPYTDNENWLRHVVVSLDDRKKLQVSTIPVNAKYLAPPRAREYLFETDY